jgi:hypothetical protein
LILYIIYMMRDAHKLGSIKKLTRNRTSEIQDVILDF